MTEPNLTPAPTLLALARSIFERHGTPTDIAQSVASSLVESSLLGHDSHGVLRVGRYVEKIRARTLQPAARPELSRRQGATATIDGRHGFGQTAARYGAETAIKLATEHGVAAVALANTNHVGRLGEYTEQIAAAGLVALAFASGAGPGGAVTAHGGCERLFGTNPLAWALPVPAGRGPLVADFSTSAIPEGKVGMAQAKGEALPPGAVIDRQGNATLDPAAFYAGGALLPFGGHKGSSLVLFIELVANLLASSVPASSRDYRPGNPTLLIALSVDAFGPREEFLRYTEELLARVETSRPAAGGSVRLPHAIELETARQRRLTGIPIPDPLWRELQTLATESIPPTSA